MQIERTIVISDIHGCLNELEALLDKIGYSSENDSLTVLGDIINRGPHSRETFLRILDLNAVNILGNHEWHLLKSFVTGQNLKKVNRYRQLFGCDFQKLMDEIAAWPAFIETDDYLFVHGGLVPGVLPENTDPWILTSIRTWDGKGVDLNNPSNPPWFELYNGKKTVVFGHWASLGGVVTDKVIGIDTGCVYGRRLTALLLPERRLVSVPASRVYFPVTAD